MRYSRKKEKKEKKKKKMRALSFLLDAPLCRIIIIRLRIIGLCGKARRRSVWELSDFEVDFSLIGYAIFTFRCQTERY